MRRVLDDPAVWAAGVLAVAVWCVGQVVVGEPVVPVESLPPAVYVVGEFEQRAYTARGSSAHDVVGTAVLPQERQGTTVADTGDRLPSVNGPAVPTTPSEASP